MIDRLLGGTGTDTEVDGSYVYTDIEIALYESVIKHLIAITKDVWSTYITWMWNWMGRRKSEYVPGDQCG